MTAKPISLRSRLIAAAAVFIALALLAAGVAVEASLRRFVQGQVDQRLDTQVTAVAAALEPKADGTLEIGHNVDGPPFDDPRSGWFWRARTVDQAWRSRGSHEPPGHRPPPPPGRFAPPAPPALAPPGPGEEPNRDAGELRLLSRRLEVGGRIVLIEAGAPVEAVVRPLRDALVPLVTALLVLGAGLLAATLLQVRVGLRPLADLRSALAKVRAGAATHLPASQPAELVPLVGEMNALLDETGANLERARRHVANLAHALKTPLAALTLALERSGTRDDPSLLGLALAMDRRIRHHLARARAAALGTAARRGLDLAPRLADHVAAFAKIHAGRPVRCQVRVPEGLGVACDGQDLDEMLGNVLDNAHKWARSAIVVEASAAGRTVEIAVEDDGPGVPEKRFDDILQPGRRLDESVPGDGFGLPIVRELTELYGGRVTLARARLGGLRVVLTLPATPAPEHVASRQTCSTPK